MGVADAAELEIQSSFLAVLAEVSQVMLLAVSVLELVLHSGLENKIYLTAVVVDHLTGPVTGDKILRMSGDLFLRRCKMEEPG